MTAYSGNSLLDNLALRRRMLASPLARRFRHTHCRGWSALELGSEARPSKNDRDGVVQLTPESFAPLLGDEHRKCLDQLMQSCAEQWPWPGYGNHLNPEDVLAAEPALYHMGLAAELLDLAESYLGEPCLYLGPVLKREPADGKAEGTRQWHTDVEDDSIFRLLIYLSPVGPHDGGFEFVTMAETAELKRDHRYRSGYLPDAKLRELAPGIKSECCCGSSGTAIMFDGAKVLHRAGTPRRKERRSLTFTYVTRRPLQIFGPSRLTRNTKAALWSTLSDRERACIPPARWI